MNAPAGEPGGKGMVLWVLTQCPTDYPDKLVVRRAVVTSMGHLPDARPAIVTEASVDALVLIHAWMKRNPNLHWWREGHLYGPGVVVGSWF